VLDVLAVLDVVGGGGAVTPLVGTSPTTPLVGTSPARTVIDISPARATANTKRFMLNLLCAGINRQVVLNESFKR
jgi:hypothetical protein